MEDMDKSIEVVKAAMEKEKKARQAEKSMDEKIDNLTGNNNTNDSINPEENKELKNNEEGDEIKEETEDSQNVSEKEKASEEVRSSEEAKSFEEDKTGGQQCASDENETLDNEASGNTADEEASCEEDSASGEKEASEKASKVKSFFKSSKDKELEAKDQKIKELTDKYLRIMAEFDNFRKRTEKEKAQMFDLGVKSVIEKILPVIDNFERGLKSIDEANKDTALAQGYNMIYKQLMTTMDQIGVKPIEAVGKQFDPNYHNAVMHSEDESLGENIVAEEFQKGYMYKDMIVRHSMVRVVN